MVNKGFIAVLMLVMLITGCAIRGAGVKVDLPGVEIGLKDGGIHCPPGQAKKGRC